MPKTRNLVPPMVHEFYHSDAVDHTVDDSILRRTFADAVRDGSLLRGVMLLDGERPVGFAYITCFYAWRDRRSYRDDRRNLPE